MICSWCDEEPNDDCGFHGCPFRDAGVLTPIEEGPKTPQPYPSDLPFDDPKTIYKWQDEKTTYWTDRDGEEYYKQAHAMVEHYEDFFRWLRSDAPRRPLHWHQKEVLAYFDDLIGAIDEQRPQSRNVIDLTDGFSGRLLTRDRMRLAPSGGAGAY